MMRAFAGTVLAATLVAAGAAPSRADDAGRYDFSGTVGSYPVGLTLRVAANGRVEDGHYFYTTHLTDIPLALRPAPGNTGNLVLSEPGGGTFALHPVGKTGPVASLADAIGLDGQWTGSGHTLPVSLQLGDIVSASGPRYADVTNKPDAAFEARVRGFRSAVLDGQRDAAGRFVSFPLRVNGPAPLVIRSPPALSAHWTAVFSPAFLAKLRATVPHDLFVHDGEAALGAGLVWFDAKGASQINPQS